MGEHGLVRRAAARAAGLEQRGLEPAAMLVRAFEIERGRPGEVGADLEHEGVGRAGVEPNIEDVVDLLPLCRVVDEAAEEALARAWFEPSVSAFFGEGFAHSLDERFRPGIFLARHDIVKALRARIDIAEHGDGHAPGALARHHPVRLGVDHAADAVLALRRHPARLADGGKGAMAQRVGGSIHIDCAVHGDEPLRRVAEDHRLLRAPGMGIVVAQPSAGDERVGLDAEP